MTAPYRTASPPPARRVPWRCRIGWHSWHQFREMLTVGGDRFIEEGRDCGRCDARVVRRSTREPTPVVDDVYRQRVQSAVDRRWQARRDEFARRREELRAETEQRLHRMRRLWR